MKKIVVLISRAHILAAEPLKVFMPVLRPFNELPL